jgi:electron transport complex protein RnfC
MPVKEGPSSVAGLPARVVLPLQDLPDAPFEALVKEGEQVKAGQKIGTMGAAPVCLSVHASISGAVSGVGPAAHPLGFQAHAVSVDSDGGDEISSPSPLSTRGLKGVQLIEGFQEAGIPLDYHLLFSKKSKALRLLINATEFEPLLSSRHQLIKEQGPAIFEGLRVLAEACGARQAVIFVEKAASSLLGPFEGDSQKTPAITVRRLSRAYPETAASFLASMLNPKKLRNRRGDSENGHMWVDLMSLCAISRAWSQGIPFVEQLVSVVGSGVRTPQNLWAKTGTPLSHLVQHAGGNPSRVGRVALGGPLMGTPQHSPDTPLVKKARGVFAAVAFLFDEHRESRFYKRISCVNCAKCVDICPVALVPSMLATFVEHARHDDATQWGIFRCLECGLCEYVCPSRIPLLALMRLGKFRIKGEGALLARHTLDNLRG